MIEILYQSPYTFMWDAFSPYTFLWDALKNNNNNNKLSYNFWQFLLFLINSNSLMLYIQKI